MEITRINEGELVSQPSLLSELVDAKIAYYGFECTPEEKLEISQDILNEIRQGSDYFVGRVDGILTGYVQGYQDKYWYQGTGIYVIEKMRGRGIAGELKKAQIEYAKSIGGCVGMRGGVIQHNTSSKRMFEKLGFRFENRGDTELALLNFDTKKVDENV